MPIGSKKKATPIGMKPDKDPKSPKAKPLRESGYGMAVESSIFSPAKTKDIPIVSGHGYKKTVKDMPKSKPAKISKTEVKTVKTPTQKEPTMIKRSVTVIPKKKKEIKASIKKK